jgi:FAD/FMN-containing dehydrogenase
MGVTGIIVDLSIRLVPLEGTHVRNTSTPFRDIPELFDRFDDKLPGASHCVAWMDLLNFTVPQGVVIASHYVDQSGHERHSAGPHLPDLNPWYQTHRKPVDAMALAFNTLSNRAFNIAFAARHRTQPVKVLPLRPFLFPWDMVPDWNRLYGRKGFVEYQCCLPASTARDTFSEVLGRVLAARRACPVYFAAAKRMRPGSGILSFPLDGFSLLLDFPAGRSVWPLLDEIDEVVANAGGRVFLAKDGRLSATMFARMYSNLAEWQRIRASIDPHGKFGSDMARRIRLVPS